MPNLSTIIHPLTELVKKNLPNRVKWTEVEERALESVKYHPNVQANTTPPDTSKNYIIQCDSSNAALGSALVQLTDDGREVVIAWGSKKLAPREVRYSTIEKELYAWVWSLQNFENYIYGKHVEIQSDHRPLA